ncbi:MAG: flagellar biosynthesis protein FlhF, partial [Clostridia bacterium]|nr:flagellar biosynthesis protein FlhF [Clostridia bacterium]
MKIRRYMGSNTQEAILKVKMDLGNDAVILNTRKVRQKGL